MAPPPLESISDDSHATTTVKSLSNGTPMPSVGLTLTSRPWRLLYLSDVLYPPLSAHAEHPDILLQRILQLAWTATIRSFAYTTTLYIGEQYHKGRCYVGEAAHAFSEPTVQIHIDPHDAVRDLLAQSVETFASLRNTTVVANGISGIDRKEGGFNVTIVYERQPSNESCKGRCETYCLIPIESPQSDSVLSGLLLYVRHSPDDKLHARLDLGDTDVDLQLVTSLLHSFNQALSSMDGSPAQTIGSLELCSSQDRDLIAGFTGTLAPPQDALLHDLCFRHVQTTPDAQAVCSWDGNLTYRELEEKTCRLADWLVGEGVGPSVFVSCAFYKSTWAIVARLAVLMAGGAYVCVDGSDPPTYLNSVLERTRIKIMLTSAGYKDRFSSRVETVFEVSEASLSTLPMGYGPPASDVTPTDPCVVLFTSGTTGNPKAIVQEHRSYASALTDYLRVMEMGPHSRMFQFDAYAFDISNNDFLATLMAGGCCCVPTVSLTIDALMNDMNELQANIMFVTPSIAIDIDPDRVPTLKMMCIGGEPVSDAVLSKWLHRVQVVNQYGMGEIASLCAYNRNLQIGRGAVVGRPATGAVWIVSPDNPEQLMPVGAVGELLVEGPHLAQGYLDHVSGKPENFLSTAPAWMAQLHPDRPKHRLYRSGDLGRWNHDQTLELIGRRDNMLKLDGARVEAEQVEYVLRRNLTTGDAAIVDVLGAADGLGDPILVVYLYLTSNPMNLESGPIEGMQFRPISDRHAVHSVSRSLSDVVSENLPTYYVPSLYLLIDRVPRTKSNKMDRRKLHILGQAYYMEHRGELGDITVWPKWE